MKKELVHPTLPVTEIVIRETIVKNGRIEEVEKKVSVPRLLIDSNNDEMDADIMKKGEQ